MSSHQIKYNEALVKKLPLKYGKVGTDHMEHALHTPSLNKSTPNSGMHSKTTTGQHRNAREQQAKGRALPGFFNQGGRPDFGDHAKTIKVDWGSLLDGTEFPATIV